MVVAATALLLASCSHGSPAVSKDASKALQAKVAQIRASASAHDATAVATELDALRAQVAALRRDDQISAAAATQILAAATAVSQNLPLITTTTTTSPPPTEQRPGKGKGKGNDGGD